MNSHKEPSIVNLPQKVSEKHKDPVSSKHWSRKTSSKFFPQSEVPRPSAWLNHNRRFFRGSINQAKIVPSSTAICFVCGNTAYEDKMVLLYSRSSRSQSDAPFFPFLEYHDPAPGADAMKGDWSVISCSVCSALLSQQWKSFEKGRMPINKRLYWLKRPSGCEIRQPVSQIELEEILNEHSRDNFEVQSESDEECSEPKRKTLRSDSIASKELGISPVGVGTNNSKKLLCYSCGKGDLSKGFIFPVHCKPSYEQMRVGVPFYPTVLSQKGVLGSTVLYNSITYLCKDCFQVFKPQWHFKQSRILETENTDVSSVRIPLPEVVLCYLCSSDVSTKFNDGLLHVNSNHGKKNWYYQRLSFQKPIKGSVSLSWGFTYLCPKCHTHLTKEEKVEVKSKTDECDINSR